MTNGDMIRKMSNKELLDKFGYEAFSCKWCIMSDKNGICKGEFDCEKGILEWLNKECEDEKEETSKCENLCN